MSAKFSFYLKMLAVATAILGGIYSGVGVSQAADLGLQVSGPSAVGRCSELVLTCENGQAYPVCPIAVSIANEVVTATLGNYPGSYVRLIPMGVGYRYAGRGIWFDGLRNEAVLNFGKSRQIACSIVRS